MQPPPQAPGESDGSDGLDESDEEEARAEGGGEAIACFVRDAASRVASAEARAIERRRKRAEDAEAFGRWAAQWYDGPQRKFTLRTLAPFVEAGVVEDAEYVVTAYIDAGKEQAAALNGDLGGWTAERAGLLVSLIDGSKTDG